MQAKAQPPEAPLLFATGAHSCPTSCQGVQVWARRVRLSGSRKHPEQFQSIFPHLCSELSCFYVLLDQTS